MSECLDAHMLESHRITVLSVESHHCVTVLTNAFCLQWVNACVNVSMRECMRQCVNA